MVAEVQRSSDWLRPGCGERCERVRAMRPGRLDCALIPSHDPETHEAYGRLLAGPRLPVAVVCTDSLVVDRWRRTVVSDGYPLELAGREWEILDYLAERLDRFCPIAEILRTVWGEWHTAHNFRVVVARLRTRLGVNGCLIETRFKHGYRLRAKAIVAVAIRMPEEPAKPPWSRAFHSCVCCGRQDHHHAGHGRCTRCRPGNRRHYGPCAAPPAEEAPS